MAGKHRRKWNSEVYHSYLSKGYGQGTGKDYQPWIHIQDFSSRGIVSRYKGNITGRVHHLLSGLELKYMLYLEMQPGVTDIREQFPLLMLNETMKIAREISVKHPKDRESDFPYVMTSDFLVDTAEGLCVRSVKSSKELENPRVLEKLKIEQIYWNRHGVDDWKIITEKEISPIFARNADWLTCGIPLGELIPDEDERNICKEIFLEAYNGTDIPLQVLTSSLDDIWNAQPGTGICVFKQLILEKRILTDLNQTINLYDPRRN